MKPHWIITRIASLLTAFALLASVSPVQAVPLAQTTTISQVSPTACPAQGCAAGQHLSYQLDFELGVYDATITTGSNVKICVYIPTNWYDASSIVLDATGKITGNPYTNVSSTTGCPEDTTPPTNYSLAAAAESLFNGIFVFHDSLDFTFRILPTANVSGSVLMRVFERGTAGWTRTGQAFTSQVSVVAPAATVYVANDAAACTASPCYLNSLGDSAGGIGTGLKDAVDAVNAGAVIRVLGNVALKANTVVIPKQITLEGIGEASLVSSGSICTNPMIELSGGGVVHNLNITGACGSAGRGLLLVNSTADLLIESNDLSGGADAIQVTDSGNLTVRYNTIKSNSGYALFWKSGGGSAALNMLANNVMQNRAGDQVECLQGASAPVANRRIDHNYWGSPLGPSAATTHCTVTPAKHLGAPILGKTNLPGVAAEQDTVTTSKTYRFNNQLGFKRSTDGADFDIVLVNHGSSSPSSIPFTGSFGSLNACGNYYDVFLADGASPAGSLELSLKYNATSNCIVAVESYNYCGQTTASKFPLWWFDPGGAITSGWDTTGQSPAGSGANSVSGQDTVCDTTNKEIRVTIDNSGRPALNSDMNFTPFVVGVPVPTTFQVFASDQAVTVKWSTTTEPDITGFYVLRSLAASGPYDAVSGQIDNNGSASYGGSYSFLDSGRTNGQTNYYLLRIMRSDGSFFFTDPLSIVPNKPTPTVTRTPIPTWTFAPTLTPYRSPVPPTHIPTLTLRFNVTATKTRTPIFNSGGTPQANLGTAAYPGPNGTGVVVGNGTLPAGTGSYPGPVGGNKTPGPGQIISKSQTFVPGKGVGYKTPSVSPSPTLSVAGRVRNSSDWISMVLGLLMSGLVVLGFTWYFFLRKKKVDDKIPG